MALQAIIIILITQFREAEQYAVSKRVGLVACSLLICLKIIKKKTLLYIIYVIYLIHLKEGVIKMLKKMEDCFGDTIIVKDFRGKGTISFVAEDYETHMRLDKEGLQELIENLTELKEELEKQQNDN